MPQQAVLREPVDSDHSHSAELERFVNDHTPGCARRADAERAREAFPRP